MIETHLPNIVEMVETRIFRYNIKWLSKNMQINISKYLDMGM